MEVVTLHSPLPWRLFNSDDIVDADGLLVTDFGACWNGDANAAHVVTVCNAFPALVEALHSVLDILPDCENAYTDDAIRQIRDALTAAGAV